MTAAAWNYAPKRLWKRISVYIRPDIHASAEERQENFTVFINNALARKYDLDQCMGGGVNRMKQLRRLEQASAALEQEIASLSVELEDDGLNPDLRRELERQRAEIVALKDKQSRTEADATARVDCIRRALDAIIGDGPLDRYGRMLPENDTRGDRIDLWEGLVADVSHRCGAVVDPSGVAAEVRSRLARADAGEDA